MPVRGRWRLSAVPPLDDTHAFDAAPVPGHRVLVMAAMLLLVSARDPRCGAIGFPKPTQNEVTGI